MIFLSSALVARNSTCKNGTKKYVFAIVSSSEKLETVSTASVNVTSLLTASLFQRPISKLNSDKFCFHVHIELCTRIK